MSSKKNKKLTDAELQYFAENLDEISSPDELSTASGESSSEEDPFHNSGESDESYKPSSSSDEDIQNDNSDTEEEEGNITAENSGEQFEIPAMNGNFDQDTLRRMPATDASYANILKKNVNLIVKPKNNDQPHAATRLKMRQSVDPVINNIKFSQVKNIKNGGLLIKCDGSEDASKLKELASLHLADDYEVKEVRKFNPRLKIVGMSECIDKDQLSVILKSQNSVFQNDSKQNGYHGGRNNILTSGIS
ncbi:unnamed protein product [Acanthoscelides obtectus]|uniref:Uncharacterized protein n=1 Tax=Acanthoscelides obtectus TaxID=200917 RepID=A0A9P0MHB0_ACAOB|nr:unnamed protein product [Acanthoscelides obtectus]CAK1670105.1 hypothetical protein AOBTE_LOCUS27406 [Acanthoscelides obtectus]